MTSINTLKERTISGMKWNLAEKYCTQFFSFVIGIILARILMPSDYGIVVMGGSIIGVLQGLVNGGFTDTLIQKSAIDEMDKSTIFYFMLMIAVIGYGLLYCGAPYIALIYKNENLCRVLRIYGISLLLSSCRSVYTALIQKKLEFKKLFFSSLGGTVIAGVCGIGAAYAGWGVYALILYTVCDAAIDLFCLVIQQRWIPSIQFSFKRLKEMYKFGFLVTIHNLFVQYSNQLVELIMGMKYSPAELSYYNRGKQYPYIMISNVNSVIDSVLYPVLVEVKHEEEKFHRVLRRFFGLSTFFQFPVLCGFAVISAPLIQIVLTDKWLPCVFFLQMICVSYCFWPFISVYARGMLAKGNAAQLLKNEIIVAVVRIVLCGGALGVSARAVAWAFLSTWVIDAGINCITGRHICKYGFREQLQDVGPNIIATVGMVIAVWTSMSLFTSNWIKFGVGVVVGVVVYVLIAMITRNDSLMYCIELIQHRRHNQM